MKQFLAILACVAVAALIAVGGVAAAEEPENESVGADGCESIDSYVYICDVDYEEGDGSVSIKFYSVENGSVDLLDVGAALADRAEEDDRQLRGGERTTISFGVTESESVVGVMIRTERGVITTEIVAEPSATGDLPSLPGDPSSTDWITVLFATLSMSFVLVGACGWWFKSGNGGTSYVF